MFSLLPLLVVFFFGFAKNIKFEKLCATQEPTSRKKRTLHPTMNHAMAYGGVPVFWFGFNPSGFRQFFFRLLPAALCFPQIKKRKHTGSEKQNKKLVDKNCLTLPYRTYNTIHYTCQARIILLPNACRPLTRPSTAASTAASTSFSTGSSIQAKRCPATKPR